MSDNTELNLTEICQILKKRSITFVLLFTIVFISTLLVTLITPTVYKSSAKIIIQNETNLYPAGLMPMTSEDKVFLNTQKQIMSSSFIVNKALEALKKEGSFAETDYADLKNKISVNYLEDSDMLEIAVYLNNAEEAINLANGIVNAFINYHTGIRGELVDKSLGILNNEIAQLNNNIQDVEMRLKEFADKDELGFYQARIPYYVNTILELEKRNALADADITRIQEELAKATNNSDPGSSYPLFLGWAQGLNFENSTSSLASVPWMYDLKKKLSDAQTKLSRLLTEYTEDHPEVAGVRNEITSLQGNLDTELKKVLKTYTDHYGGYIEFLRSLKSSNDGDKKQYEAELNKISTDINKAATRQIEYNALLKNFDIIQDIYAVFLKKQNELQLLKKQNTEVAMPNMRIFEFAAFPLRPVSPNIPLNMVIGFCFGIFLGISGSLFEERRESLKSRQQSSYPGLQIQERRGMRRELKSLVVGYELKGKTEGKQYAVTENISGTGVIIRTKELLDKGRELSLEIQVDKEEYIYATGEIVWMVASGKKNMYDLGVHFIEIQPQEREKLINYLYGEHYLSKNA